MFVVLNWIGIEDVALVTDREGNTKFWAVKEHAEMYAKENCQNFKVVEIV